MMAEVARVQHPDPRVQALEAFVASPNMLDTMVERLANPATPTIVRQMISDIINLGQILGTNWQAA
jgi:hypothetical protein